MLYCFTNVATDCRSETKPNQNTLCILIYEDCLLPAFFTERRKKRSSYIVFLYKHEVLDIIPDYLRGFSFDCILGANSIFVIISKILLF
jgi:hypothetical protein